MATDVRRGGEGSCSAPSGWGPLRDRTVPVRDHQCPPDDDEVRIADGVRRRNGAEGNAGSAGDGGEGVTRTHPIARARVGTEGDGDRRAGNRCNQRASDQERCNDPRASQCRGRTPRSASPPITLSAHGNPQGPRWQGAHGTPHRSNFNHSADNSNIVNRPLAEAVHERLVTGSGVAPQLVARQQGARGSARATCRHVASSRPPRDDRPLLR